MSGKPDAGCNASTQSLVEKEKILTHPNILTSELIAMERLTTLQMNLSYR